MTAILCVCVGNICRSPMAEGLFASALPNALVHSAGVGALVGEPADPIARKLLTERGLDLSSHRAQQINKFLVGNADFIFVMDQDQRRFVEDSFLSARGKIFRLAEHIKQDIPDPYRHGEAAFKNALELIDQGVSYWAEKISRF